MLIEKDSGWTLKHANLPEKVNLPLGWYKFKNLNLAS